MAAAAILVREMEEVLLARIAVGEQNVAKSAKIFCFSASDSDTAYAANHVSGILL